MCVLQVEHQLHCQLPATLSQLVPEKRSIADLLQTRWRLVVTKRMLNHSWWTWYRSQMNTTVPDGLTLAENLLQWVKTWLVKLDQPTSIPLATIKAVSASVLQIQAALKQALSGELWTALHYL